MLDNISLSLIVSSRSLQDLKSRGTLSLSHFLFMGNIALFLEASFDCQCILFGVVLSALVMPG